MFWRWVIPAQNDFAARMDWCVKEFAEANHSPVAMLNGTTYDDATSVSIDATPGSVISLDATGSTDPDKNSLSYNWWVYKEVGSYGKAVNISDATSVKASMPVPSDALGKTIHVILEVKDNGTPALIGYRRAIVNVKATVPVLESEHADLNKGVSIVRTSLINGMASVTIPLQSEIDSKIVLCDIAGKVIPFTLIKSGSVQTLSFQSSGVVFLKIAAHGGSTVYKCVL
jgi:hypothetical protein